jgi:hypothetical protein
LWLAKVANHKWFCSLAAKELGHADVHVHINPTFIPHYVGTLMLPKTLLEGLYHSFAAVRAGLGAPASILGTNTKRLGRCVSTMDSVCDSERQK